MSRECVYCGKMVTDASHICGGGKPTPPAPEKSRELSDNLRALAKILDDADACIYLNPFVDSKNASEFGKYAYAIRELKREREAALAAIAHLREVLNTTLNYLHFHADDLTGDDCIGDKKRTHSYDREISDIEHALSCTSGYEVKG